MTGGSRRDDEPLSSEEMIERARGERSTSSEELLQEARESVAEPPEIEGLDDIAVDIPVASEFPHPIPQIQANRPRRVHRPSPVIPQGPFSTDRAPRAIVVAIAAVILLIAIGVFVAAVSVTGGP